MLCASVFAHSGMFWGIKKLSVAKTKWFDIIYPEKCRESASILFEKADGVYEEVTAQYGLTPAFRMPVVITPAVDQFNAFWAAVPYNHIAIYDTGVSGSSELAVFSETLLSTFRHELTHAVTYNMKNKFWRTAGKVFGDCYSPGMVTVTTGMAEGATVTSESAAGEGRINDEYAMHYVKQAKIEGTFPAYHDVSGSGDVFPTGAPYYFNGAFHQWLQDNYGLAAYANFWFRVVNAKDLTISGAFKNAFGIQLKTAWKEFEKDFEVPDVAANPVSAGIVRDFFIPSSSDFSILNDAGSAYNSLSASATRLIWLDQFGGRVFLADVEKSSDQVHNKSLQPVNYRQLFAMRGINNVRLSNDGRLIAVSCKTENTPGITALVKIYDIKTGKFFKVKDTGLKEAAIVATQDSYYLIAQKYAAQRYTIAVYKIEMSGDSLQITDVKPYSEITMGYETNPFAFTPLEDGSFAFIKREQMQYSICVSALDGTLLKEFAFENGMVVRSLSYNKTMDGEGEFCFSYAQKGTLPRAGCLNSQTGVLRLSNEDISGGVWEPVLCNDEIVYVGSFYRQNRLLCMNNVTVAAGRVENSVNEKLPETIAENGVENASVTDGEHSLSALIAASSNYKALPYFLRGIFIPVGRYKTDSFGINAYYTDGLSSSCYGFTYMSANPWTEGSSDLYTLTCGWNALSKGLGLGLQVSKGTASSLFQSTTEIKSEFDPKGWKQSSGTLSLATNLNFGRFSTISIGNSAVGGIGKQDSRLPEQYLDPYSEDYKRVSAFNFWDKDVFGIAAPADDTIYYMLQDVVSIVYSNIRRAGTGRFEYLGFAAGVNFGARYDADLDENKTEYVKAMAFGGMAMIYIPRILPFESKYGYTYNFPLRLNGTVFPVQSKYGYTMPKKSPGIVIFDAVAETTIFSMDIQKALPFATMIYLNDVNFSAGYAGTAAAGSATEAGFQNARFVDYVEGLFKGNGVYLDSVYIKSAIEFTPNIGVLANNGYKMAFASTFSYVIHSCERLSPQERIKFSFGLDANF